MSRLSPPMVMVLGIIFASFVSLTLMIGLLFIIGGTDSLKLLTPFASVLAPFFGGLFAVYREFVRMERQSERRHQSNVLRLNSIDEKVDKALEYHEQEDQGACM